MPLLRVRDATDFFERRGTCEKLGTLVAAAAAAAEHEQQEGEEEERGG